MFTAPEGPGWKEDSIEMCRESSGFVDFYYPRRYSDILTDNIIPQVAIEFEKGWSREARGYGCPLSYRMQAPLRSHFFSFEIPGPSSLSTQYELAFANIIVTGIRYLQDHEEMRPNKEEQSSSAERKLPFIPKHIDIFTIWGVRECIWNSDQGTTSVILICDECTRVYRTSSS